MDNDKGVRLFIDGGSLHATIRCLDQMASPGDAARQLHTATQLAFSDNLLVGAYGGGSYLEQTQRVRSALEELGFEADCIEVADASPEALEQIYLDAANALAPRLSAFTSLDYADKYANLSTDQSSMEQKFHAVLCSDLSVQGRTELYEDIKLRENNGHIVMLAKSDALWDVCRRLVRTVQPWIPEQSARLATIFRIFIHQEYANRFGAFYAPGVDRGRALRAVKIPEYVWSHIQDMPGKGVEDFKLGGLGLPSVSAVLASRARGDPKGLMLETLLVREKAKPLRDHVRSVLAATASGDHSAVMQAHREMEQLSNDLKVHLAIKPATTVAGALDVFNPNGFLWSLLSGNVVGGQKIISVVAALLRSRRIAVLSEMAAEIRVLGIDPSALVALERGASANRHSADGSAR